MDTTWWQGCTGELALSPALPVATKAGDQWWPLEGLPRSPGLDVRRHIQCGPFHTSQPPGPLPALCRGCPPTPPPHLLSVPASAPFSLRTANPHHHHHHIQDFGYRTKANEHSGQEPTLCQAGPEAGDSLQGYLRLTDSGRGDIAGLSAGASKGVSITEALAAVPELTGKIQVLQKRASNPERNAILPAQHTCGSGPGELCGSPRGKTALPPHPRADRLSLRQAAGTTGHQSLLGQPPSQDGGPRPCCWACLIRKGPACSSGLG